MKSRYIVTGFIVLLSMSLFGCGGGTAGAPGSSGSGDTGIEIRSVSMVGDDGFGADAGELEVDTFIHACPPTFTTVEKGLFMAKGTLTIDATKLTANLVSDPFPASVEQCTITYLKANEDPSAPIIPSLTIYPNCPIADAADNTCLVTLMDIQRKQDFWINIHNGLNNPSEQPTHYIAQLKCTYMGNFGESGSFTVEHGLWLSDWDHCQ
jgi:hypothetical protein